METYAAINSNLERSNVSPSVKKDKILTQFAIIKENVQLNVINESLGKTPLRFYTEFINENIYHNIKYVSTSEDYIGRFYGEFMSYSGSGQKLGIVLTPKHITELFCELLDLEPDDIILDPCCGTGSFLVAAMHYMVKKAKKNGMDDDDIDDIKKNHFFGIEQRADMFTIATTNMILRGDGNSKLINDDFLSRNAAKIQLDQPTVGIMNPPYSQGTKEKPEQYEISFVEHLLDSLVNDGKSKCAVIVPLSAMVGKTIEEEIVKKNILDKHTLEGVITLNGNTFYPVGTMPCIALFTAGKPHPSKKVCKFIDFSDDGYEVQRHKGLVKTESADDKKQHLLDVWFDRIDAPNNFCVKSTIDYKEEWLHDYYYFNDEIPTAEDFDQKVGDYLSFEFNALMANRSIVK